jgi:hypothetical protein
MNHARFVKIVSLSRSGHPPERIAQWLHVPVELVREVILQANRRVTYTAEELAGRGRVRCRGV